jgi:hypothetical protein
MKKPNFLKEMKETKFKKFKIFKNILEETFKKKQLTDPKKS